jgi:hypothetical protein
MKFDPPPGSVFGGYGFWSYSGLPGARPARHTTAADAPQPIGFGLRALIARASRLLPWTRA